MGCDFQKWQFFFIGIFITMVPALMILKAKGADLGLTHPWQFFWITGALSSFLDNTPTYLVFFTTAGASHLVAKGSIIQILGGSGTIPQVILMAISAGAVFMGSDYLYWKCTKLHGALHCRGKQDQRCHPSLDIWYGH